MEKLIKLKKVNIYVLGEGAGTTHLARTVQLPSTGVLRVHGLALVLRKESKRSVLCEANHLRTDNNVGGKRSVGPVGRAGSGFLR